MAASLEEAGDKENLMYIRLMTAELLSYYSTFKEKLEPLVEAFTEDEEEEGAKEEISKEELEEIWTALTEMVEAFDFDSADDAYGVLAGYKLPEEYEQRMPKLKKALKAVNREEILNLLKMEE
jgi:hypothetical protein